MTNLTPEYRDAFEEVEACVSALESLLHVTDRMAHNALATDPNPDAAAVLELLKMSQKTLKALDAANERAWRAQGGTGTEDNRRAAHDYQPES